MVISEDDILQAIAGHEARNLALVEALHRHKVAFTHERLTDQYFWAPDEPAARGLAGDLAALGLLIENVGPGQTADGVPLWDVSARVRWSPAQVVKRDTVELFVRVAAKWGAQYDGWGTAA